MRIAISKTEIHYFQFAAVVGNHNVGRLEVAVGDSVAAILEEMGLEVCGAHGTTAALALEKLEAMTCVCSVGLDMIAIPGDTPAETVAAIIADEAAIGMVNNKTTAVRVIPAPGKKVGDSVEFGGLLGHAPVIPVREFSAAPFIRRGGRIPAPLHSLRN